MGFLLGAFGKLAAGSRYRSLQARLMRVQSRLRRATRDVADMEKALDRQQKAELNQLSLYANSIRGVGQGILMTSNPNISEILTKIGSTANPATSALTPEELQQLSNYQQGMTAIGSNTEQYVAFMKQEIENRYEYLREMQLEPLKDEEDSLQLEKDTLESQIQIAKADYEACQKMEQSDAQMMKPNYTGGQG